MTSTLQLSWDYHGKLGQKRKRKKNTGLWGKLNLLDSNACLLEKSAIVSNSNQILQGEEQWQEAGAKRMAMLLACLCCYKTAIHGYDDRWTGAWWRIYNSWRWMATSSWRNAFGRRCCRNDEYSTKKYYVKSKPRERTSVLEKRVQGVWEDRTSPEFLANLGPGLTL